MNLARTLVLLAATASSLIAQDAPITAVIQVPTTLVVSSTLSTDIDGDGLVDLVLSCHDPVSRRREQRVHLRGAGTPGFSNEPSRPPDALEEDVVAFTYADCHAAPGRELVLLTAERCVAVVPGADGSPSYEPLFAHRLVWPVPQPLAAIPLPLARGDFDGDGKDDLLVPQPDGAALHLHGRASPTSVTLTLPPWRNPVAMASNKGSVNLSSNQFNLALNVNDEEDDEPTARDRGPLLSLRTRAPQFRSLDRDGDGKLDLVSLRNGQLWDWKQTAQGVFTAQPAVNLPLPADRLTLFDPAFDVQLADIDGDHRPDLVLVTSARRNDEVEVRIDLFRTRADGSWPTQPDGRLRVQTLANAPQLVDADGDGKLDLVAMTVRTDLLKGLTGDGPASLEVQLNVFRGNGEKFATPAAMTQALQLPVQTGRHREPFLRVLPGRDQKPGAVLLRVDDTLLLRPLLRQGERLQLAPATTSLALAADARVVGIDEAPDGPTGEVLVITDHEVLHARMR